MPRNLRLVGRTVAVAATAVVFVTCTDTANGPRMVEGPSFEIRDGASGGNPDVFFLPPLASTPTTPAFGDRPSNPNLAPIAEVCTRAASALQCLNPSTPDSVARLPMTYDAAGEFYQVNWQTGGANLTNGSIYRVQIFVGRFALALRDVLPQPSARGGSCLTSDSLCTFNNGSNLPIKVRIETGAVCLFLDSHFYDTDPAKPCATASLNGGGTLPLSDLGTATVNQGATINLQPCNGDPAYDFRKQGLVDLPTFGDCVQINNLETYQVVGTATLCKAQAAATQAGLSETQVERMTVHRNSRDSNPSDNTVYALPHAEGVGCTQVGLAPRLDRMEQLLQFARETWRSATDRLGIWLQPATLWACDRGCGGTGGFESYYQVLRPAWMGFDPSNPTGNFGALPVGTTVTGKVKVFDSGELPSPQTPLPAVVQNVRLTVSTSTPGASVAAVTPCADPRAGQVNICSGSDGVATFTVTLGGGSNTVTVSGIGVGTQDASGTVLNVFAPSFNQGAAAAAVTLGVGTLTFTATGLAPLVFVPDPPTGSGTLYTDASGIATFPNFQVCASPRAAGIAITGLQVVTNNGTYKSLGGTLPTFPVTTGADGCFTFSGVTVNGTGAFKMVANGQYLSEKFNVKPGK